MEDLFGDELPYQFALYLAYIRKHGNLRLVRKAEEVINQISYKPKVNYGIRNNRIVKVKSKKLFVPGLVLRSFLLYGKQLGDISSLPLPDQPKLIKWRTGLHGESGLGYNLTTLVRTESNRVANEACIDVYKEIGIEKYQCVEYLDDVTCEFCHEINGQIFNVSDAEVGVNMSPFHPNCRGFVIPVRD